jgi:hypothetical protein
MAVFSRDFACFGHATRTDAWSNFLSNSGRPRAAHLLSDLGRIEALHRLFQAPQPIGRPPMQTFEDSLPRAKEKMLNAKHDPTFLTAV